MFEGEEEINVATKIYGASDDLIECEGDLYGECGAYSSEEGKKFLVVLSDGTVLAVSYGKPTGGIWQIDLLSQGTLFEKIDVCTDEDAKPYSDIAHFKDGIKWGYVAKEWEKVK
jgi:hypothetical protein